MDERSLGKLGEEHGERLRLARWLWHCPTFTAVERALTGAAPSLIPKQPGAPFKTNKRDAKNIARLHRAGELITRHPRLHLLYSLS